MKITDEEYNQIIREITQRIRDSVCFKTEDKIKKEMPKAFVEKWLSDVKIAGTEINYNFQIVVGDIHQIFSRIRRKRLKRKK